MDTKTNDGMFTRPRVIARRVAELIRAHPGRHDQGSWLAQTVGNSWKPFWTEDEVRAKLTTAPEYWGCGTTACVAGWVVFALLEDDPQMPLSGLDGSPAAVDFFDMAQSALELDDAEAANLFLWVDGREAVLRQLDRIAEGVGC